MFHNFFFYYYLEKADCHDLQNVLGWGREEEAERRFICTGLPESGKTRDLSHSLHPC